MQRGLPKTNKKYRNQTLIKGNAMREKIKSNKDRDQVGGVGLAETNGGRVGCMLTSMAPGNGDNPT